MDFKLPLKEVGKLDTTASSGTMAQSPTSPANYDFLMRRASAVYEAQFEVYFVEYMNPSVVYVC